MTTTITFQAADLATGWLSVALASGSDEDLPALNRTISIEQYDTGIRLCSTDRYVLLHSWVPALADRFAIEPGLDEAPVATAVAIDSNGRALGLLGFMRKLAKQAAKDELPQPSMALSLNVPDEDDLPEPTFGGMESEYVVLEHPDHELVKLRTYGGDYPNWRTLHDGFTGRTTKEIALNPELIGRLAKLGALHAGQPLIWRFGGADKAASLEVLESLPSVRGLVMPVKWLSEQEEPEAA